MRLPSALANGRSRARASGDHDVLGGKLDGLVALLDAELALAGQRAEALDHRDLVLLHQAFDAGVELPRHLAAAIDDLAKVEADIVRLQPIGIGVGHIVIDLRRAQQRLGRDAAPVEADAAEAFTLDDRDLHAELAGTDRRDIAAGAGAEDDEIVGVSHGRSLGKGVWGEKRSECHAGNDATRRGWRLVSVATKTKRACVTLHASLA